MFSGTIQGIHHLVRWDEIEAFLKEFTEIVSEIMTIRFSKSDRDILLVHFQIFGFCYINTVLAMILPKIVLENLFQRRNNTFASQTKYAWFSDKAASVEAVEIEWYLSPKDKWICCGMHVWSIDLKN